MKILLEMKKYLDMVLKYLGLQEEKKPAPVVKEQPKKKKKYYKPKPKKNAQ